MSTKVLEIQSLFAKDDMGTQIAYMWDKFSIQRREKLEEWKELNHYIMATDTSKTSNKDLPWKNKTTRPKLAQLRENLHANYLPALFPNDEWLKWEGYTQDDATNDKVSIIESYMQNKCRESNFRTTMSILLNDYIDYGNAFATVAFERKYKELANGEIVPSYIGPKVVRVKPDDIVFNPLASEFKDTFKIIRSIKTIGELNAMAEDEPDNGHMKNVLGERNDSVNRMLGGYSWEDGDKAEAYEIEGFGNIYEYYQGNYVEVLEFWGDFHDANTGTLHRNKVITVIDRQRVIRSEDIPSWLGHAPIYHVAWKHRQENLWGMGPLDNLVGMQYRIDHLENLKADAMDLMVHPPLLVRGDVNEFTYQPFEQIKLDGDGDVRHIGNDLSGVVMANNEIQMLEAAMEEYAGAPKQAMGIRTPGEKTAFEVSELANASGRIFQEKITSFEILLLEPILNAMLETSRRNLDVSDTIKVLDNSLGAQKFMEITKDDITANGVIRPIGARHFAAQSQLIQNLSGVMNSAIGQMLQPHTDQVALMSMVEDVLGLERYKLFRKDAGVYDQAETMQTQQKLQQELELRATTPTSEDFQPVEEEPEE